MSLKLEDLVVGKQYWFTRPGWTTKSLIEIALQDGEKFIKPKQGYYPDKLSDLPGDAIFFILNTFKQCEFCKAEADDICHFRMWQKTDAEDRPIDDYLIACRDCDSRIEEDSALFIEVPWGSGGPGKFMLVCGDCPHRDKFSCKHPDLKANGGEGLQVNFSAMTPRFRVCGTGPDGKPFSYVNQPPAISCVGKPEKL